MRSPVEAIARAQHLFSTVGATSFLVLPKANPISAGQTLPQISMRTLESGFIMNLCPGATADGGTADDYRNAAALLSLRVRVNGEDLFMDGSAGAFVPCARFTEARAKFNFTRRVNRNETILVEYRHEGEAPSPLIIRPSLVLAFIADRQIANMAMTAEVIG